MLVLKKKLRKENIEKDHNQNGDNKKVFWKKKLIIKKEQRIGTKNLKCLKNYKIKH